MPPGPSRRILLSVLVLASVGIAVYFALHHPPVPPPVVEKPTTRSTTSPATTLASTKPVAPHDFLSLVKSANPEFPATAPFVIPVELHEGARLSLDEPLCLDSMGEVWVSRSDAPPLATVLKKLGDEQVHFVREQIVFVHHALDDAGHWQPQLVVREKNGEYTLVSAALRLKLGNSHSYQWGRAFSWNSTTNEGFVVPSETGVSVFRPRSLPVELHYDFFQSTTQPASSPTSAPGRQMSWPQMLLDTRGLLAWMPWDPGMIGSHGAARFVDGGWIPLGPEQGWPEKIVHLVPLLDGSVIQLTTDEDGAINQSMAQLDAVEVDRKVIDPLIAQLSDDDAKKRDSAYAELTRYGSGLWPILEKVIDDQPPEGHLRIEQLLAGKTQPTLGMMTLMPGKGHVVGRFNGGALLLADSGVSVPNNDPQKQPTVVTPAYISFRPGRAVELASQYLVTDLPDGARIDTAPDEWIVTDDAHGPRRLLGNHLEPILRKSERAFSQFVGIDRRGRWFFRKPGTSTPTLVLDPTLPDATPRLAAWVDPVACDAAGWDEANWPVFSKNDNAWSLHEADWAPLPPADKGRKFYKSLDEMPSPATVPTTLATTTPTETSQPATTQAVVDADPIFVDADGTRYFDGKAVLRVIKPDRTTITWPLPPSATGEGEVHLLRAGEGRLFLFNQPGRLLRILPTSRPSEPFKLEATFTDRIPNTDHLTRVWLDPAGRIDLVYDASHLTMLFPDGRIPRAIAEKMPVDQLKKDDE